MSTRTCLIALAACLTAGPAAVSGGVLEDFTVPPVHQGSPNPPQYRVWYNVNNETSGVF